MFRVSHVCVKRGLDGAVWVWERHPEYFETGHAHPKRSHGEVAEEGQLFQHIHPKRSVAWKTHQRVSEFF